MPMTIPQSTGKWKGKGREEWKLATRASIKIMDIKIHIRASGSSVLSDGMKTI